MNSILPNYYANGEEVVQYTLMGENFLEIPDDAIGVLARDNDSPLGEKDSQTMSWLFDIAEKSDTAMILRPKAAGYHSFANYLGAIISADRQTVYWVNNTRPLP